ncbi:universal stress protein [Aestuariimicrobium ganziense]|uniref:universal stress protein n=1 Tax=Aestuariimicrobium ganziense TaxID=2773677 RepID=UPI00194433D8|nr:universal stress protein [Aestuariimicrobium ganziense]
MTTPDATSNQNTEYPRILVGVDGSEDGLRAVAYASRSATLSGAGSIHLVHAVDDAVLAGAWGVVYDPGSLERVGRSAVEEATEYAVGLGVDPSRVHGDVVLGNASAVLAKMSGDHDLLVTGRRAVSGFERMFVGSTSVSLASTAKCPLVVISAASSPDETGRKRLIAVGVDGERHSETTLRYAFEEAQRRGARLLVANVQSQVPAGVFGGYRLTEEAQQQVLDAARAQIESQVGALAGHYPDVEYEIEVQMGHPVDVLIATTEKVDLLVMGMRAPSVMGFSIGGVTRAVLAHAACPLCIVR